MLYEGICEDGPLENNMMISRYPKGFLLIDKPANECWIYDWTGVSFSVRADCPLQIIESSRYITAEGQDFDVIAAPWVTSYDN